MTPMRRCERTCECLAIVLRQSLPESNVPMLKKNMKLSSARYMSPSYQVIILCFYASLQGNDEFLPTQALLMDIQRLLNS